MKEAKHIISSEDNKINALIRIKRKNKKNKFIKKGYPKK